MSISKDNPNTYYEEQEEAWFEGGREWYIKENKISEKDAEELGIPSDFDPFFFYAETCDDNKN